MIDYAKIYRIYSLQIQIDVWTYWSNVYCQTRMINGLTNSSTI